MLYSSPLMAEGRRYETLEMVGCSQRTYDFGSLRWFRWESRRWRIFFSWKLRWIEKLLCSTVLLCASVLRSYFSSRSARDSEHHGRPLKQRRRRKRARHWDDPRTHDESASSRPAGPCSTSSGRSKRAAASTRPTSAAGHRSARSRIFLLSVLDHHLDCDFLSRDSCFILGERRVRRCLSSHWKIV